MCSLSEVASILGFSNHCYGDNTFPTSDSNVSAQISACLADYSSRKAVHQLKVNLSKNKLFHISVDVSPIKILLSILISLIW